IENHTPLARWAARGELTPVDDDRYAGEFLAADAALRANGYEHYEVSNAARPGYRARHNSAYWSRSPFIGLGPSAHSGFGTERRWNVREWAAYERATREGETVVAGREQVDPAARRLEEVYLGLRTSSGLASEHLPAEDRRRWVEAGWATATDGRVRLTAEGWLRLDALVASVSG
ncbi:MAG: radical SAM family heme chaperone HemW, partial [Gemmatimonadales bacterium]